MREVILQKPTEIERATILHAVEPGSRAQALFEKCQYAQTSGLFPPGRRSFFLKSVRIPAKKLLAGRKNLSPLVICPFIKQGLGLPLESFGLLVF